MALAALPSIPGNPTDGGLLRMTKLSECAAYHDLDTFTPIIYILKFSLRYHYVGTWFPTAVSSPIVTFVILTIAKMSYGES